MELFTATEKLKKVFFDNWSCSMCALWVTRHTSIWYSSSCHTHVNMDASIFFTAAMIHAFRSARSRGNVTLRTLHEMHIAQYPLTYLCDIPTHKTTPPQEQPFSHYIHSHRLVAEMWTTTKNNLLGKKFLSCSFYLYRVRKHVSYGFIIINFCNPGVHYEMPCIEMLTCMLPVSVVQTPYMAASRSLSWGGNWSENLFQFSSPTWFLKPCRIWNKNRSWQKRSVIIKH